MPAADSSAAGPMPGPGMICAACGRAYRHEGEGLTFIEDPA